MSAFCTALFLIFIAEMGDKTQFMTLAFSARYKAGLVILGVTFGTLIVSFISVALGETVGKLLPYFWINIFAGFAFIIFGLLTLKGENSSEEEEELKKAKESKWGPIVTVAATFLIAELGDKTMLATVAIASRESSFIQVWLGSTVGLVAANILAVAFGKALNRFLSGKMLKYVIASIYIFSGLLAIAVALHLVRN